MGRKSRAKRERKKKKSIQRGKSDSADKKFPLGNWIGEHRRELEYLVGVLFLTLLAYSNTFHAAWSFDDTANIVNNPNLRHFSTFWKGIGHTRPVAMFTFWLNYRLGGYNPFYYHLTNLAIHMTNTVLVFILTLFTFSSLTPKEKALSFKREAALLVAALFALHPIQTNAVTYIVQREAALSTLFVLLTILLYAKATLATSRKGKLLLYATSYLALLLGMGCKENAAMAIPLTLLYDLFFLSRFKIKAMKSRLVAVGMLLLVFFIGASIMGYSPIKIAKHMGQPFFHWDEKYGNRTWSPKEALLTAPRVFFTYISLLLLPLPSRFTFDSDFWVTFSRGLFHPPSTAFCWGLLFLLISLSLWKAKKYPLISFGFLWYTLAQLLETWYPLGLDIYFEHRNYLPFWGFALSLCGGTLILLKSKGGQETNFSRSLLGLTVALSLILTPLTLSRNRVWRNRIIFWQDVTKKVHLWTRPWNNLGQAYLDHGMLESAKRAFEKVISTPNMPPKTYRVAYMNLGILYAMEKNDQQAEKFFKMALKIKPKDALTHMNLGILYLKMAMDSPPSKPVHKKLLRKALKELKTSIKYGVSFPEDAYYNMAFIERLLGRKTEAKKHALLAIALAPKKSETKRKAWKLLKEMTNDTPPESQLQR